MTNATNNRLTEYISFVSVKWKNIRLLTFSNFVIYC